MLDMIPTDLLRILVIIPVLLYASYTDILNRRVDDKVWYIPTFLALIVLSIDAYNSSDPVSIALSALFSLLIVGGSAYIIYKYRIFYGADYKAFLLISILFPWQPVVSILPLYNITSFYNIDFVFSIQNIDNILNIIGPYSATQLFGFTVFVNTTMFSIIYFVMNIIHNIRHDSFDIKKPLRSTCARKVNVEELNTIYAQVVKKSESNNKILKGMEFIKNGLTGLSTDFFKDYENWYSNNKTVSNNVNIFDITDLYFESFLNDNEEWESTNIDKDKQDIQNILSQNTVWVTPGVPFIVPITLGVITSIIFGNLMYITLSLII